MVAFHIETDSWIFINKGFSSFARLSRFVANLNFYRSFVNKMGDAQTRVFVCSFSYSPKLHRGAITLFIDCAATLHTSPHPPGF